MIFRWFLCNTLMAQTWIFELWLQHLMAWIPQIKISRPLQNILFMKLLCISKWECPNWLCKIEFLCWVSPCVVFSFFLPSLFFFCWNWLLLKLLLSKWKPIINFVAKPKPWDLWHKGYSFVFWSQYTGADNDPSGTRKCHG